MRPDHRELCRSDVYAEALKPVVPCHGRPNLTQRRRSIEMVGMSGFLRTSAMHPRLRSTSEPDWATTLEASGHALIPDALEPGLAAEADLVLSRLPLEPEANPTSSHVAWCGTLVVPPTPDPQNPACLYRLLRFLEQDLPAWVGDALGRPLRSLYPGRLMVWTFRKGAFADAVQPLAPDGIDVFLSLSARRWPADWGGHLGILDGDGQLAASHAPGPGQLHLTRGWRVKVPLVVRPVEAVWLRSALVPA